MITEFSELGEEEQERFVERAIEHLAGNGFIPWIDDDYMSTRYADKILDKAEELWQEEFGR
jgi:hypothetical protein